MVRKKKTKSVYVLPTEKSQPLQDLGAFTMLMFGRRKIGKTTMVQHMGKVLFLLFEPGAKALSVYQETMNSWVKFKAFVRLIEKDNTYDTVAIDTVDFAYDDCSEYVCGKKLINDPADLEWGEGWRAVKKEFTREIKKITRSGKGIVFISHQKTEQITLRSGKKYDRKTNTLTGQGREIIEGLVDIWVNYDFEGRERVLTIMGDENIDAGHRLNEDPTPKFLYTDGTPVRSISMGQSSKEAYENFVDAFNNKLKKGGLKLKGKKTKHKRTLKLRSK